MNEYILVIESCAGRTEATVRIDPDELPIYQRAVNNINRHPEECCRPTASLRSVDE